MRQFEIRQEVLGLLADATLDKQFTHITGFPGLQQCHTCFGVVETSSRIKHLNWHNENIPV